MHRHILQSETWGEFKNSIGTPAITCEKILYTKHKIPFTTFYYAYCPRVRPIDVDFTLLESSIKDNNCVALHFDVPNVIRGSGEEAEAIKIFSARCDMSSREEFAKANFLMDLTSGEEELLKQMHNKQRYNISYAEKKGVKVRRAVSEEDFEIFFNLYKGTGERQGFYFRSHTYLHRVWEIFKNKDSCDILIAEYEGKPLASWMLLTYENVLYYPYGGSTVDLKNLQANALIGWEAIKYGKEKNCTLFDMWGAAEDLNDTKDSYYGFSQFKAKFGGEHVIYMDSYDFVVNPAVYKVFTTVNNLRWKILNILR